MAELELAVLPRQCLRQRLPDQPTLARRVAPAATRRNAATAAIDGQFTTAGARIKRKRLSSVVPA
jgi:hypothetical protein